VHNPNFVKIMNIAINIRFYTNASLEGYNNFVKQLVTIWLAQHPEHHFFLITDNNTHQLSHTKNSTIIQTGIPARLPVLWRMWYNFFVPKVLKKYKIDVFVSPDGFCSTKTKVPQILVLHDLAYKYYPQFFPKNHVRFFNKHLNKMANKAQMVCTVSQNTKADLIKFFNLNPNKIDVVYSGVKKIYQPLAQNIKSQTLQQYTNGQPYFLHIGTITPRKNIMALLKAFSKFKRLQQSSIKLMLIGKVPNSNKQFLNKLQNYKYKNDVVLIQNCADDDLANIIGSAYALVYPSLYEGFGVPPLEAMQAGIPVIASGLSSIPEICGQAAHYIDPTQIDDIYEGLKTIYINEPYKNNLVQLGFVQTQQYTWQRTCNLMWDSVLKITENK
jgi:glycosyltransferase involved in cell wall biosynthesis